MSDMESMKIINDLRDKMSKMLESFEDIKKDVNALQLNEQRYLTNNMPIPPGIACKFAYDSKGLILSASQLVESDIPELNIDHIKGLRTLLNEKISDSELERLQIQVNNDIPRRSDKVVGTGCKVNYDKFGFIISVADLTKDDIPKLDMDHIDGLSDKLTLIESMIRQHTDSVDEFRITPGSGCKVTYDEKGRVTSSRSLSMDDIPMDIISRLNVLESAVPMFAKQNTVDMLTDNMSKKLNANSPIRSGSYTKVYVDENGLVTRGDQLRKEDLPSLSMSDINGLDSALRNKASQSDFIALSENVSSIMGFINNISEIKGLENTVKSKANNSDLTSLANQLNSLQSLVDNYIQNTHSDTFEDTIKQIQLELSNLSGRLSVLEKKK